MKKYLLLVTMALFSTTPTWSHHDDAFTRVTSPDGEPMAEVVVKAANATVMNLYFAWVGTGGGDGC